MENNIPSVEYRTKHFIFEFKLLSDVEKHYNDISYEIGQICVDNYVQVLPIIYLKNCYERIGGHCKVVIDKEFCFIAVSRFFIDNWYKLENEYQFKLLVAVCLHEFGHYENGDLEVDIDPREYNHFRLIALGKGTVTKEERMADEFATKEIGKSIMIAMIDKLIKIRKERSDAGMYVAIKEMELRKRIIKNNK